MKKIAWLLILAGAALVADEVRGGPLKGGYSLGRDRIPGAIDSATPGLKIIEEKFRAGERACVIAFGDQRPIVDLEIVVFDAKNQVVAQAKWGGDLVAAIWYPPRDGAYKIEVRNYGKEYNDVYVSVK